MKRILIVLFIISLSHCAFSQMKLSLLDGRQKTLESYVFKSDEGVEYIEYTFTNNKGKLKTSYSDLKEVYSISINGKDSIIYTPFEEGEFSTQEMTQVVLGKQLAIKEYNAWWAIAGGMIVGCGSMFIPMDAYTRLLIPIAYNIGMGFVKPRESYITKRYSYATGNEWLIYGYQNSGRKKIFKNTIIGTVSGLFVAGAIAGSLQLINGNK